MKKYLTLIIASVLALSAVSCSDWMTAEPIYKDPYNTKTEEEIKALLDYKRSEHRICFGWYSSWTGMGDKMQSYLIGLPDSMDVESYRKLCSAFDRCTEKGFERSEGKRDKSPVLYFLQRTRIPFYPRYRL